MSSSLAEIYYKYSKRLMMKRIYMRRKKLNIFLHPCMLMHDLFCLYISIAVMSLQIDKKYDQCMHQISIPATDENKTLHLQLNPVAE